MNIAQKIIEGNADSISRLSDNLHVGKRREFFQKVISAGGLDPQLLQMMSVFRPAETTKRRELVGWSEVECVKELLAWERLELFDEAELGTWTWTTSGFTTERKKRKINSSTVIM